MVYEFFYTRADGFLQEICISQEVKMVLKKLHLSELARGNETLICKWVEPFYVMLVVQRISDPRIDQRTIPFIKGILLREKDTRRILGKIDNFYRVKTALTELDYGDFLHRIQMKKTEYQTIQAWIHETGKDPGRLENPVTVDQKEVFLISRCILSGLLEKRHTYIENQISMEALYSAIWTLPYQIKSHISFSYPYGGSPEGECLINVMRKGAYFNLDQDGLRVGVRRLLDAGNTSYTKEIESAAGEMVLINGDLKYKRLLSANADTVFQFYDDLLFISKCREINKLVLKNKKNISKFRKFIEENEKDFYEILPLFKVEGIAPELLDYLEAPFG